MSVYIGPNDLGATMTFHSSQYAEVYRVLDGLKSAGLACPGAPGVLFNAIDRLRYDKAPHEHIRLAESLSVAIIRLEGAVRHGRHDLAAKVRSEIALLNTAWMDTPIEIADSRSPSKPSVRLRSNLHSTLDRNEALSVPDDDGVKLAARAWADGRTRFGFGCD